MNVIVYVEGPSDANAMEALLAPLIKEKLRRGIHIKFFGAPTGHKKKSVLLKVPVRAVNILRNRPKARVVALPDLYPPNAGFPHETVEELREGMQETFRAHVQEKGLQDARLGQRFEAFCFKHDLEALVLAAENSLGARLGTDSLPVSWQTPVEDQNHDKPPKRIVEELFEAHGTRYRGAIDAPLILSRARYEDIVEQCPQGFGPFVEFLERL
ncbi:DUF4276 family protein [Salisaeta longa]|uniref:DUF4276 family protein n=1 Tax=Salisaeta longa TaxID=503170 RepID=UPI0003B4006B|nr:DUF4276 family protein [Salisaeta longa]